MGKLVLTRNDGFRVKVQALPSPPTSVPFSRLQVTGALTNSTTSKSVRQAATGVSLVAVEVGAGVDAEAGVGQR